MKQFKPGLADEAWKVMICARDEEKAQNTLHFLCSVLTDCGSDYAKGRLEISAMSGADIIEAVECYAAVARKSVALAISKDRA
jgi:hypothetical protein